MATWRTLISEKSFLKVQERARSVGAPVFTSARYFAKELIFSVCSASGNGAYTTKVEVVDLDRRKTGKMLPNEINSIIRESNLRVTCNCPAYKYWGYKYISNQNGYGLTVESRYPSVRNPKLRGYVCKHIYRVLQIYPFIVNDIRVALAPTNDHGRTISGNSSAS